MIFESKITYAFQKITITLLAAIIRRIIKTSNDQDNDIINYLLTKSVIFSTYFTFFSINLDIITAEAYL